MGSMKYDRATVRVVLDLLSIEGAGFDRGYIHATLFITDEDEQAVVFRGQEETGRYMRRVNGEEVYETRGSGFYKLNEAAVDRVMQLIKDRS